MTHKLLWPKGSINEGSPSYRNPVLAAHGMPEQALSENYQTLGPGTWLAEWFLRTEGLSDKYTREHTHVFGEQVLQMANKPMRRCSSSLVIREAKLCPQ